MNKRQVSIYAGSRADCVKQARKDFKSFDIIYTKISFNGLIELSIQVRISNINLI